jgi:uncharacterized protein (UPF0335 family)
MMNADLHDICTRIARLETERKELAAEVAAIKKDAKEQGYDAGLITKTVAIMLKSGKKQREALDQVELFDTYLNAVGLLSGDRIVAVAAERLKPGERLLDPIEQLIAEVEPFLPPHDPETGEITEQPLPEYSDGVVVPHHDFTTGEITTTEIHISSAHCLPDDSDEGANLRSAAGEHVSSVPPRPLAGSIDMGDIPEALDRRKRQEVAA